jgi:hypothetical protein
VGPAGFLEVDVHAVTPKTIEQVNTKGDEQQVDKELERRGKRFGEHPRGEKDDRADEPERQRVPKAPNGTVTDHFPNTVLTAHEHENGCQMVGLDSMPMTKPKKRMEFSIAPVDSSGAGQVGAVGYPLLEPLLPGIDTLTGLRRTRIASMAALPPR